MFSIAILNILLAVVAVYFANTLLVYWFIVLMFSKLTKVFTEEQTTSFGFLSAISVISLVLGFITILIIAMDGLARYKTDHTLLATVCVSMTFGMGILVAAMVFIALYSKKK